MKVAMINDAASVGETLLKYLPSDISCNHLKRDRGFYNKTLGLAWKISKLDADLYHAHYLLQDCYLAQKLGKHPLVGHVHGSDVREMLHTKRYGWIVKSNLKNCDKIFVTQPTLLDTAKEYNETAEYLPIPFDPKLFYPEPSTNAKTVLIASQHNFRVKGTNKFLHALSHVKGVRVFAFSYGPDFEEAKNLAKRLQIDITFIPKRSHSRMNELYWDSDLVLGSWGIGQLDTVAVEAMACGRPVIHYLADAFKDTPIGITDCVEQINALLYDKKAISAQIDRQLEYVNRVHRADILASRLYQVYVDLLKR